MFFPTIERIFFQISVALVVLVMVLTYFSQLERLAANIFLRASARERLKAIRLSRFGVRLYLFRALLFSLIASLISVFHHGTGILEGWPLLCGMQSLAEDIIELVRFLISSSVFPVTCVGVICLLKLDQSPRSIHQRLGKRTQALGILDEINIGK